MKRIEFEDALVVEPAKVSILDEMPVGSIVQYGGVNAPAGWLICDGSTISRTEYKDLFNAINTNYGVGDGSTTFNLPNLKGKVAVGLDANDSDFNELGKTGGEKTHTLTIDEMPSHKHIINKAISSGGDGSGLAWSSTTDSNETGIGATGGSRPHNILQPYAVINYIIKAVQSKRDFNIIDAVTDGGTDLNKSTFNGLQDNIEEAIEEHYSTEETFTGKYWIDGKKIYRKVYKANVNNITETLVECESELNELIDFKAYCYVDTSKQPLPFVSIGYTEAGIEYAFGQIAYLNKTAVWAPNCFYIVSEKAFQGYEIVTEYTKTTE